MPIYEYRCEACGEVTEVIQRFGDAPLVLCPRCGGALKKMVSAPAFQFKGTGWYVTDYARKSAGGQGSSKDEGPKKKADSPPGEKSSPTEKPKDTSSPSDSAKTS